MSYRQLEIWALAREISILVHKMSLELPKFELFETGQQIRRSSKSVRTNIVEGYGRRAYKQEFIRFIIFSLASNCETMDHLETLYETGSLQNQVLYNDLHEKIDRLGKKLNNFLDAVQRGHNQMVK
ncbi:four helix bundle protein [Polluticoccus soli]|uniref:four helix bundle protein n=1 Tax=Polluticoccus soli TaxID=3034150 RepID=UPI0023E117D9|nr:four helix bundle protein [Flavipsychrobacter sp. JY13-12]